MAKNHIQRVAAPRSWKIERKNSKFITKPNPGSHSLRYGMAVNTVIKEILKVADTTKEVKYLLNNKEIIVNGKPIHDVHYCVGLMDILSIPKLNSSYRVVINKRGRLGFISVSDNDTRVLRVDGKYTANGGKRMLTLSNGANYHVDKVCAIGDSVLIKGNKIEKVIPLKEGAYITLIAGSHIGASGNISKIYEEGNTTKIEIESPNGKLVTLKEFAYVVGDKKPEIQIA